MFECAQCNQKYRKYVEKDWLFQFLLGLDKSLDEVRRRILTTKPLPSIWEAYSEVRRDESRKKVMLGKTAQSTLNEGSALAVHMPNPNNQPWRSRRPWCNHCWKPGHSRNLLADSWQASRLEAEKLHRELRICGKQRWERDEKIETNMPFSKEQFDLI